MRFNPSIHSDFARLCAVMLRGELLALRCSGRQAQIARGGLRRQLTAQQRHERLHAMMFRSVLAALPSRRVRHERSIQLLDVYEQELDRALDRGDLPESLLGLQVILEGAAVSMLRQLDLRVQTGNAPLQPARCLLVAQEDGHQLIGERALASSMEQRDTAGRLQRASVKYADLVHEVFASCRDALESFGIDPAVYDASHAWRRPD
jgi:hypothetical protein